MPQKRTIPRACERCGADFLARLNDVKDRRARYCSPRCAISDRHRPGAVIITGNGTALIPLRAMDGSIRAYAIVDEADATWADQWRWCRDASGYAVRTTRIDGRTRTVKIHRELLGLSHGDPLEGDHINRNKLDNRRSNLRAASRRINGQNMPSQTGTTSRYRGVSLESRTGHWVAQVTTGGQGIRLGCFTTEEEAAEVARSARRRLLAGAVD